MRTMLAALLVVVSLVLVIPGCSDAPKDKPAEDSTPKEKKPPPDKKRALIPKAG